MSGSRGNGSGWLGADRHASSSSLAAFAEGALSLAEAHTIAGHVAGCDECAARLAAYAEVDALVSAAPLPLPPAALHAGLYARIGAAETRQASNGHLASEVELTVREIEPTEFSAIDTPRDPQTSTHPARLTRPAIPTIARWGGAVAALLIVALLASVLITLGLGRNGKSALTQPTATVLPQPACAPDKIQASLPDHTLLNDLAMTSPGTGWAVGATPDTLSTKTTYHSLILRLSDCRWAPFGARLPNAQLQSLAMVSSSEGWAAGEQGGKPLLLHFENGTWKAVTPPTGNIFRFQLVRAGPNGEVWVVGNTPSSNVTYGSYGIAILRLSGGQWERIETSFVDAADVAPVGPGDAWIIGMKKTSVTLGFEELAHMRGDSLVSETPLDGTIGLTHLRMLSPTDGWAMGVMGQGSDTGDNPQPSRPIVFHYDGAKWAEATTRASAAARVVDVLGQGTAWSYTTKGVPEYIVSTQRQVAGQWRDVPWPFKDILSFSRLTCATPDHDDCWAIGQYLWPSTGEITYLLLRYTNGAWHEYGHAT